MSACGKRLDFTSSRRKLRRRNRGGRELGMMDDRVQMAGYRLPMSCQQATASPATCNLQPTHEAPIPLVASCIIMYSWISGRRCVVCGLWPVAWGGPRGRRHAVSRTWSWPPQSSTRTPPLPVTVSTHLASPVMPRRPSAQPPAPPRASRARAARYQH